MSPSYDLGFTGCFCVANCLRPLIYDLGAGLYRLPGPLVAHERKPDYTHIRSPDLLRLSFACTPELGLHNVIRLLDFSISFLL